MIVREHSACLFASAPITDCGRDIVVPAAVLASSWPLALGFGLICCLAGYAYLRTIWPAPIDWESGDDERPTIEIRARRAGE